MEEHTIQSHGSVLYRIIFNLLWTQYQHVGLGLVSTHSIAEKETIRYCYRSLAYVDAGTLFEWSETYSNRLMSLNWTYFEANCSSITQR